ncbi:coat protein [Lake Sarah-associated circular virus-38]|uniref:Coat protein n=1 Tax=Lake Sarah-associated circular virus-38 TaxID=1685766 RepID=A0A126G8I1_9VIRU|nr:coat protein [Lake Sarah-associated circular virus-38]ALE29759.1 coat protein [Lake Sarah-associated circular virus-38]ALE29762.1 coat protein [Lake Sarah-associated circular virus-38]
MDGNGDVPEGWTDPITMAEIRKYIKNSDYDKTKARAIRSLVSRRPRRSYRRRRSNRRGSRRRGYRGYGAYSRRGSASGSIGQRLGGYLGTMLGGAAQNLLKTYTGLGAYQVKGNALMPGAVISNPNPHGGQVFRGSDYLGDIFSSPVAGQFTNQSFPINAALEQTFPKLAQFLQNFDQYVIEGLIFEFRSMSCDSLNSTNTALGSIIAACNYNVLQAPFASKAAMEEYEGGVSQRPSSNMQFFVECARAQSPMDVLYTRTGAIPANADLRMYDLGNFQIASQGLQGTSVNMGELWVHYQVAGLKEKIYAGFGNYNSAYRAVGSGGNNSNPLGNTRTDTYNSGGFSLPTSTTIQFPNSPFVQTYLMELVWTGGAVATLLPTFTATNAVFGQAFYGPPSITTTAVQVITLVVQTTPNTVPVVTLSTTLVTLPTVPTVNIQITQQPNLITGV